MPSKWNPTLCGLLCLASSRQHVYKADPCCSRYQYFIPFHHRIKFCDMPTGAGARPGHTDPNSWRGGGRATRFVKFPGRFLPSLLPASRAGLTASLHRPGNRGSERGPHQPWVPETGQLPPFTWPALMRCRLYAGTISSKSETFLSISILDQHRKPGLCLMTRRIK